MLKLEIPSVEEIYYKGELNTQDNWLIANIETTGAWPVTITKVAFRKREIFIIPITIQPKTGSMNYPAIALKLMPGENSLEAKLLLSHFLSSLAWVRGNGFHINMYGGGSFVRPTEGYKGLPFLAEDLDLTYIPDPQEKKTRRALALYREGLILNHPGYKFLSFYKIINILHNKSEEQIDWISKKIKHLKDHVAGQRVIALQSKQTNIAEYIYGQCRCAVSHAYGDDSFDPDNSEDLQRFAEDLPIIQELAKVAIQQDFGIKSAQTVYEEHLYELEGFHEIFSPEVIEKVKNNELVGASEWPNLPNLSLRLAKYAQYQSLENMSCEILNIKHGEVIIKGTSQNSLTEIIIGLDFANERLIIQPFTGALISKDDGTVQAATSAKTVYQFMFDYFLNGALEVYETKSGRLIGRCDPFIPQNADFIGSCNNFKLQIAILNWQTEQREIKKIGGKFLRPIMVHHFWSF